MDTSQKLPTNAGPDGDGAAGMPAAVTQHAPQLKEGPLHVLKPSADHSSLVANAAALDELRKLEEVSICAVIGSQRSGKSTLMNLLHGRRLDGFIMGHYMDPQTHGLWVWPMEHPTKPGVTVLFIDSEGLDSPNVPEHYNWALSAVTLLIADVFMYQSKGSIEQSQSDRLEMILRVSEQLNRGEANAGSPTGHFLWILRDHQLKMRQTPREEMLEKLSVPTVASLKRCFGDLDCVPLPRPADGSMLPRLDHMQYKDLSPDFREEFVVFERRLFDLLRYPREFLKKTLTGGGVASLLEQYADALQDKRGLLGDICEMPTQRQLLNGIVSDRVLKVALATYSDNLRSSDAVVMNGICSAEAFAALLARHVEAAAAAEGQLAEEARGLGLSGEDVASARNRLRDLVAKWDDVPASCAADDQLSSCVLHSRRVLMSGLLNDAVHSALRDSEAACQRVWEKLWDRADAAPASSFQELWSQAARTRKGLYKLAPSPARTQSLERLDTLLRERSADLALSLARAHGEQCQSELRDAAIEAETRWRKALEEERSERKGLRTYAERLEERLATAEGRLGELAADVGKTRAEVEGQTKSFSSQLTAQHGRIEHCENRCVALQETLNGSEERLRRLVDDSRGDMERRAGDIASETDRKLTALGEADQRQLKAMEEVRLALEQRLAATSSDVDRRFNSLADTDQRRQAALDEATSRLQVLSGETTETQRRLAVQVEEGQRRQAALDDVGTRLQVLAGESADTQRRLTSLADDGQRRQSALDDAFSRLQLLASESTETQRKLASLREQALDDARRELEQRIGDLKADIQRASAAAVEERAAQLQASLQSLAEQAKDDAERSKSDVSRLDKALDDVRAATEHLDKKRTARAEQRLVELGEVQQSLHTDLAGLRGSITAVGEAVRGEIQAQLDAWASMHEKSAQKAISDEVGKMRASIVGTLEAHSEDLETLKATMGSFDTVAIWESFAHFSGQIADIQKWFEAHGISIASGAS